MKLPHGWKAVFDDIENRVHLSKRMASDRAPGGWQTRHLCVAYRPPFLRHIDKAGNPDVTYRRLPPSAADKLLLACAERWGTE